MGHDSNAPTTTAGDAAEGAELGPTDAAPGEVPSSPSGPAGPGPEDGADEAGAYAEYADVEWAMPFWARNAGDVERLELTSVVRGAIAGGKLVIVGEVDRVPTAPPRRRRG